MADILDDQMAGYHSDMLVFPQCDSAISRFGDLLQNPGRIRRNCNDHRSTIQCDSDCHGGVEMSTCWLYLVQDTINNGHVYVVAPSPKEALAAASIYLAVPNNTPMRVTCLSGNGDKLPALLISPEATKSDELLGDGPRPNLN